MRGLGYVNDLFFFQNIILFYSLKIESIFFMTKWFLYFSNVNVIGPSPTTGSIPPAKLVKFFIIYDFIFFNQRYFWRINLLVWKKRSLTGLTIFQKVWLSVFQKVWLLVFQKVWLSVFRPDYHLIYKITMDKIYTI